MYINVWFTMQNVYLTRDFTVFHEFKVKSFWFFFRVCCHCKQIISLYLQSRKAKFNYKLHLSYQSGIIFVLFLPGTKQNNSN